MKTRSSHSSKRGTPFFRKQAVWTQSIAVVTAWQLLLVPNAGSSPCNGNCSDGNDVNYCVDTCCDPGSGSTDDSGAASEGCQSCGGNRSEVLMAMPRYWVSQPYINLRLEDVPISYQPARGLPVRFQLSYRQRGGDFESPAIFSVGTNWSCSFRAFLLDTGMGKYILHRGGGGGIVYNDGQMQYRDGAIATGITGGYQIVHRNGAVDYYTNAFFTGVSTIYFLGAQADAAGNATIYTYSNTPDAMLLLSVTDPDGNSTRLFYENSSFTNRVTRVVDPFNRTNVLTYDAQGFLTNTIDPQGLSSSFSYDLGARREWITNMVTPYGATRFVYGGVYVDSSDFHQMGNVVNRSVEVTLPTGGKHLYLYRHSGSDILPEHYSVVPDTGAIPNTFDNDDQQNRNSFHWNPRQYALLSTTDVTMLTSNDFKLAQLSHWLYDAIEFSTLSLKRDPSPDGATDGQITWYDYEGKPDGFNDNIGTNAFPSITATVLPNGDTSFTYTGRNTYGLPTKTIATYSKTDGSTGLRTNNLFYAANDIDVLQVVGPRGEQVLSNYFAGGNAIHVPDASYDALNQETRYTYNGYGQLIRTIRPSGLTTTNIYFPSGDGLNRLDKTIDIEIARTNAYTWANGLVFTHSDPRGLSITNYYDNLQRIVAVSDKEGTVSNFYTALDLTARKDKLGKWTTFGYNAIRQKFAETNANNVVTRYGYCDCGSLVATTNAWGTAQEFVTTYGYDYQGNRTYTFLPDATVTNWFDSRRLVYQTGDGRGQRYLYYNNQGQLTNRSNAYGTESATIFDIENRPQYVTSENGVTITNTFDDLGRVVLRGYPDGGIEQFYYSARGMVAYTNQLGFKTGWAYDEANRKTFETNASSEIIRYTNNVAGDLLSLTDGKSQTTSWGYDAFGRVTNKLDQVGTEILRYTYDANSRLTSRWSKAKGTTYYTNDAVGNLTFVNYPSSTDVSFAYDPLNRLTNMVDSVGTTVYAYTAGGELFTEDGPFASDTVTNTYSARRRTDLALVQPTGVWTNRFGYDFASRLTNVTSPAGVFGYEYKADRISLVTKLSLPNGSVITNDFDPVARLLATHLRTSGGVLTNKHEYTYNAGNQRATETRTDSSSLTYAYDNIGQLTVADSSVNAEDRGYYYDAAWNLNRRTNNGTASTFTVDGKNQLTNGPTPVNQLTYDQNGNLATSYDGKDVFTYDDENRLTQWAYYPNADPNFPSDGSIATQFVYDGLGRLRQRLEYHYSEPSRPFLESLVSNWVLDSETRYIYDGNRVIQERNASNTPTVSYTRGKDLSGSLEGAGGIGGLLARSHGYLGGNWTTHNFYHADALGNVTFMLNSSQTIVARYRYDPFGNLISKGGSLADANVYRFSSKEAHVNSGMYYFLYRVYDPSLHRWINWDPIGESWGINLYRFVENTPLNLTDPDGRQTKPIGYSNIIFFFPPSVPAVQMHPCNVTCKQTGNISWGCPVMGHNTYYYQCTDCNGKTWEEEKYEPYIEPIPWLGYKGYSGHIPPVSYTYTNYTY